MQNEVVSHVKTAIEMQKYVVLVTDVPISTAKAWVTQEEQSEAAKNSHAPAISAPHPSPVSESRRTSPNLTQDMLRDFTENETHEQPDPRTSGWPRLWGRSIDSTSGTGVPSNPIGSAAAYVAQTAPEGAALLRGQPLGEGHRTSRVCSAFDSENAGFASVTGVGPLPAALLGLRSTDLRSRSARQHLGAMLRRTGGLAPGLVQGQDALDILDGLFGGAALPPKLQHELERLLEKKHDQQQQQQEQQQQQQQQDTTLEGAMPFAVEHDTLQEGLPLIGQVFRRRATGAIGEGSEHLCNSLACMQTQAGPVAEGTQSVRRVRSGATKHYSSSHEIAASVQPLGSDSPNSEHLSDGRQGQNLQARRQVSALSHGFSADGSHACQPSLPVLPGTEWGPDEAAYAPFNIT
jgi:hypothetical protein